MKPYGYEEGKKYPLILEVHGGPHVMYGRTFFHEMQVLAAKGYAVLFANPRGSHGYGQKFVDAVRGDYGGSDYTEDRKSTRLNSSHVAISYAVFCLKKKTTKF